MARVNKPSTADEEKREKGGGGGARLGRAELKLKAIPRHLHMSYIHM